MDIEEEFRAEIENLKDNVKDLDEDLTTVKKRLDDLENRHARYYQQIKSSDTVVAPHKPLPLPTQPPPPPPPRPETKRGDSLTEKIEVKKLHLDSSGTHEWKPDEIFEITNFEVVEDAAGTVPPSRPSDFVRFDMNEILAAANLSDAVPPNKQRFATPPKDTKVEISEETKVENGGHTVTTKRVYVTERMMTVTSAGSAKVNKKI